MQLERVPEAAPPCTVSALPRPPRQVAPGRRRTDPLRSSFLGRNLTGRTAGGLQWRRKRGRTFRDIRDNDYTAEAAAERRAFVEAQTGAKLDHVGRYSFDPCDSARQHRELHRRRAGADRARRAAAHQRRARPGRFLRADGDDRRNAGRQLQPRHAGADRMRRREDDDRRGGDAALAGLHLRRRARGPRLRRLGARAFRRDQGRGGGDDPHRAAPEHRAVRGRTAAAPPVQLHDRRRRRPEHDRQGDLRRLRMDQGELSRAGPATSSRATPTRTRSTRR